MGDAWGGRSAGGKRNAVGNNLHREMAGNRDTVGGATSTISSVCKGGMVRRGWEQEGCLVALRGERETTAVHPGRNIAGG